MSEQVCKHCRFWKARDEYSGECRRHGPQMSSYHRKIGWGNGPEDREIVSHVGWPSTCRDDACGDFEQGTFPRWEFGETFVMDSNMSVIKARLRK